MRSRKSARNVAASCGSCQIELRVLHLVRHAKSSWADPTVADIDRPLSGRGRRAARTLARHLAESNVAPDVVLCSPARRARQTLAVLEEALGSGAETRIEPVVYEGGPVELLAALGNLPPTVATVMVVGHNPTLQDLALHLIAPDVGDELARLRVKFPTGAMATLVVSDAWDGLGAASARLEELWTPG